MKKYFHIPIFLLGFLFSNAQNKNQVLNSKWFFKQKGTALWHPASVPGTVHTDLLNNKLIKDPFYADNEKDQQWIETVDWEYKTTFTCDKNLLQNKQIDLFFEGLDTYAKVYLNDSLILSAQNMFRSWNVSIKKFLKTGANNLHIVFESSIKKAKIEAEKLAYTLPEGERTFTRKAQYQYGWDWGPRFVTCGIWKPIRLISWNEIKIEHINYDIEELNETQAKINFEIYYEAKENGEYRVEIGEAKNKKSENIVFESGKKQVTIEYTINKPKLWWCNGMGEQNLYSFAITFRKHETNVAKNSLTLGLRTMELVQQQGEENQRSFYFVLNGKPVFMKGANYIPGDNFLPRINTADVESDLALVKEANMNMLRVWGGGVYGSKEFYDACDKAGILVWQDFMFAGAMYPGDGNFLSNVKEEVKEQCLNLKNHPSLALWCGNNEIDEAWNNWGWQKQFKFSANDSTRIWNDYKKLFHEIIPEVKNRCDSKTPYWPSSPSIGWGHKESLQSGDSHYWGVWWGNEPFESYNTKVGRFMSEYGFQSMPDMRTINKFAPKEQMNFSFPAIKSHQKHKTGYETIRTYMERDYKIPTGFENYVYVSQLLQRDGMQIAIEAHRRSKPQCMGTLFWQLNDCWPVTSWSAIDYYKKPKAVYYDLKNSFAKTFISVVKQNEDLQIFMGTDSIDRFEAVVNITLKDFSGRTLFKKEIKTQLNSGYSTSIPMIQQEFSFCNTKESYLNIELIAASKKLAFKRYFFVKPRDMNLVPTKINILKTDNFTYVISSSTFAKDVYLYSETGEYTLSDNYFDLEAGQTKTIKMTTQKGTIPVILKAIVLNNL